MRPEPALRRDLLLIATVGYLAVPNLIFLLGWLRPGWAVVAAASVLASLGLAWRDAATDAPRLDRRTALAVTLVASAAACACGLGGLNVQVTDYFKHNLMFLDLTVEHWPVVYALPDSGDALLCYYIAYYLPASLVGKLLGAGSLDMASLAWGLLGVSLAFGWIARLGRPSPLAVLVLFTLVDGFAWLPGFYPLAQRLGVLEPTAAAMQWPSAVFSDRFWSFGGSDTRLLFPGQLNQLLWTPQHALPGWLATACVLDALERRRGARHLLTAHALTLLWSPFVAVGLIPFTALALGRERPHRFVAAALLAALVALPIGLYFLAHLPVEHAGWLFSAFAGWQDWLKYLGFLVLSIGVWWRFLALARRAGGFPGDEQWALVNLSGLTLVAITFLYVGLNNDWVMRVGLPALVVLHLTVARAAVTVWRSTPTRIGRVALALLLLAGAERSAKLWILAPLRLLPGQVIDTPIAEARTIAPNIASLVEEAFLAAQYLGGADSFFARHLMRRAPTPRE